MNHDGKLSKMADRTFASVDGEISNYNEINEKTKFETNAIQHITGIINPTYNLILPTYQPK